MVTVADPLFRVIALIEAYRQDPRLNLQAEARTISLDEERGGL